MLWLQDFHFSFVLNPSQMTKGTYNQWKFQVNGMTISCPENTTRVGFVGFGAPLSSILETFVPLGKNDYLQMWDLPIYGFI